MPQPSSPLKQPSPAPSSPLPSLLLSGCPIKAGSRGSTSITDSHPETAWGKRSDGSPPTTAVNRVTELGSAVSIPTRQLLGGRTKQEPLSLCARPRAPHPVREGERWSRAEQTSPPLQVLPVTTASTHMSRGPPPQTIGPRRAVPWFPRITDGLQGEGSGH